MAVGTIRSRSVVLASSLLALAAAGCGGERAPASSTQSLRSLPATVSATPDPAATNAWLHLAGCGFVAGVSISAQDRSSAGVESWGATADSSGCLSVDRRASSVPGSHTLDLFQTLRQSHATLMAEVDFTLLPQPLSVITERYVFQWDASKACVGEDDSLRWTASGYLAPGQSFTFTPQYPECNDPRAVMIMLTSSDPTAQLVLSTVVPENDGLANNQTQKGKSIAVTPVAGKARLCMFPNTSFTPPANYTITVVNTGTTTATGLMVAGKDLNDWQAFYWNDCLGADADRDGWSDSYEHSMAQLVYPTGSYSSGELPAGSDYLQACGTPAPDDEFDTWPPDLDDDGAVTQADVGLLLPHLGEGNGVPWSAITPNPNVPESFWNHVGTWNRFDLNADGLVNQADLDLLQGKLGQSCR